MCEGADGCGAGVGDSDGRDLRESKFSSANVSIELNSNGSARWLGHAPRRAEPRTQMDSPVGLDNHGISERAEAMMVGLTVVSS